MKKQLLFILAAIMLSWSASAQMVLEFNTNLSDGKTITLPLYGTVDVSVNWGDGNSNTFTAEGLQEHTYAAEGTYTVSISGSLAQFGGGFTPTPNMDKLVKVTSFGNIGLTSLKGAFKYAVNLHELPLQLPSTVQELTYLLVGTTIFNFDISSWDMSGVTQTNYMFNAAPAFNQDIGGWNMSNVINMSTMFSGATAFNQDISGWDVSKVTNMSGMFETAAAFNQNIGGWDVSGVTNMSRMFLDAWAFNQNIGAWNVSSVTTMEYMFENGMLATSNYNNLLIGWAGQTVSNGVNFNGGNSQYSPGAAADARAVLTGTYNWTITDGGESNALAVSTLAPSEITSTTATSGGNVFADGGSAVTARGVVWGTSTNPTITSNTGITTNGTGVGTFTSSITGLVENTTYYIRAYATNANGTEYGTNKAFIAQNPTSTVTFDVGDNIDVYPNPFQNSLNITNASNARHLVITNILGKVVMTVDLSQASDQTIETNLPSGIYLVTIIANDGSRAVRKMIRE